MKKPFFALFIALFSCLNVFSQATSMTIDCQNPGWLSSMINYGDQQTLENIKVTGYINGTDLSFLGSLIINKKLNGVVDLEDVQIVGATSDKNNIFNTSFYGGYIRHLIMPKSLVDAVECLNGVTLDSLTFGGESLPSINDKMFYKKNYDPDGSKFNRNVKHLILREGVTKIERGAFINQATSQEDCVFESITLPSSMKTIEELAFQSCYALKQINFPDNIEEIGEWAFANTTLFSDNDTIVLPKNLKIFHLNSFAKEQMGYTTYGEVADKYCYGNQHFYISENTETINRKYVCFYDKCYFHINNVNPPALLITHINQCGDIVAYVPKSSVEIYKNHSEWKYTTILATPTPAESVIIEKHSIKMNIEDEVKLNAIVLPEDADNKEVIWTSEDSEIASVNANGIVKALKAGEVWIKAVSAENAEAKDSCKVIVIEPVTGITLNHDNYQLNGIGASFNLEAKVLPENATNKEINWKSSNESVCIVSHGQVVAVGYGTAVIIATTVDGGFMAVCTVTVTDNTPVKNVDAEASGYKVYNLQGIEKTQLQKGINIIRFKDGTSKKVLVK